MFRQNTNQFLQTSRTVTFIIQKNKHDIPDYDNWYRSNVLAPWGTDSIMTWAKDARNTIEKEGDLDMHSTLRSSVLFSHISEQDVVLSTTRTELLAGNLDKLVRFATTKLPPGVADAAVLKIQRRWVANSLPEHELGYALTYAYARVFKVCTELATHLGTKLDASVPHPTSLDPSTNDIAKTRIIKLSKAGVGKLRTVRIKADRNYQPPESISSLANGLRSEPKPRTLREIVTMLAKMAKVTFEHYENHVPMLFLFDDNWKQIDFLGAHFADQAEKFLFWRNAAERAAYQRAYALVWISESWIRDMSQRHELPIHEMPIIGEQLHVIGFDISDSHEIIAWNIKRTKPDNKPILELAHEEKDYDGGKNVFFVKPVITAMKAVRAKSAG